MPLHWEILPPAQQELLPDLSGTVSLGYVLYGGTAAALRFGHRSSIDFDFFTDRPLDRPSLFETIPFLNQSTVIQDRANTLSVLVSRANGQVKVSYFADLGIGRVGIPDLTPDNVLAIASPLDLLATKLKGMQQRIEAKDYLDVIALLKSGLGLDEGLGAAAAMYAPAFQPSEALKALVFFEGGDLATLSNDQRQFLAAAASRVRRIPECGIVSRTLSAQTRHS